MWIYTGKLRYAGSRPTSIDSEVVLQSSVKALANENVHVVLTTGHQDLPKAYSPLPPNFLFEPFVPGLDMARRSDLMIHHGGYGSCQTGLYIGIPQVIIPTMSERESNARRVLQQGAGEIVLPTSDASGINKKVDASELAAKVRKVLSTPSYKENALRVSARLKEYGGAPKAAQLIEEYLARKTCRIGESQGMSRFLFTVLPSNDFGLLTRSLPIAGELKRRGHQVTFCHPARGPQTLIREAGFENLLPDDPIYCVLNESLFRLLKRGKRLRTLKALARIIMGLFRFRAAELWNADDFNALFLQSLDGMRANIDALAQIIESTKADAVVDFWNPWSCIAARLLKKPLFTVIQSHQHPRSAGFIYWKNPPPNLPTAVPLINKLLSDYGLPKIKTSCDLFMGDLTMVVGTPELDPIPDSTDVVYIGAVLWQNPEIRIPDWIAKLKPDRPVVWIYPGAVRYAGFNRQGEILLQAAIKALETEDVQVVLSTGHHDLPPSLLPLPRNFYSDPFVPGNGQTKRSDDSSWGIRLVPDWTVCGHSCGHNSDVLRAREQCSESRRAGCGGDGFTRIQVSIKNDNRRCGPEHQNTEGIVHTFIQRKRDAHQCKTE